MPPKHLYIVKDVSEMLDVPASTLRYWEEMFPMFNPNRLPSGRRRFTDADVKMAARIKELLHVKGLKIDAAIEVMNKTYYTSRLRVLRKCESPQDAIALLDEVAAITEDEHASAKIQSVINYLSHEHRGTDEQSDENG